MESNLGPNYHRRYFNDLSVFYQKKQVRYYTGVVLTILAVNFFLFFAIRPTLITIASLWRQIKDNRTIAKGLEDKINNLNAAQSGYQQIEKKIFLVDEALPEKPNSYLLLRDLELLASQNGISIDSFQLEANTLKGKRISLPIPPQTIEKPKEITPGLNFSLNVSGDFDQLKSFLNNLTRLRRLILVNSFIFKTDSENKLEKINLYLTAKAGYLKNEGIDQSQITDENTGPNQKADGEINL